MLGSLGRTGADRPLLILSSDGAVSLAIPEVTSIAPIGTSFWAKLDDLHRHVLVPQVILMRMNDFSQQEMGQ